MINFEAMGHKIKSLLEDESLSPALRELIIREYEKLLDQYERRLNRAQPSAWRLTLGQIKENLDIVRGYGPVIPGIPGNNQDDIMWMGRAEPRSGTWHRVIFRRYDGRYILQREKGKIRKRFWVDLFLDKDGNWKEVP